MLLGFKTQFEPYVLDGSKTHTIRATRKIQPRVGETCHCYGDVRQKTMHLLGRWPCVRVENINVDLHQEVLSREWFLQVWINGIRLDRDEKEALFYRDGFRNPELPAQNTALVPRSPATEHACIFWRARLPFQGHIIHWDFARPLLKLTEATL